MMISMKALGYLVSLALTVEMPYMWFPRQLPVKNKGQKFMGTNSRQIFVKYGIGEECAPPSRMK